MSSEEGKVPWGKAALRRLLGYDMIVSDRETKLKPTV